MNDFQTLGSLFNWLFIIIGTEMNVSMVKGAENHKTFEGFEFILCNFSLFMIYIT